MKRRLGPYVRVILGGMLALLVWIGGGLIATRHPEAPGYTVRDIAQGYERRDYGGYILAQVTVAGDRASARREGARILEQYIVGDNAVQGVLTSERVALTAPLVSQQRGDAYLISFILPATYTIVTVPRPNNPEIRIIQVPPSTMAVRSWYGSSDGERIEQEEQTLRDLLARDKRGTLSAARVTQYSPSWAPWFVQRNEVAIPVRKK